MDIAQAARSFLAHRRLALVGVSRDSRDFSRVVFAELTRRGYEVVPVNPIGGEGRGGMPFVRRVQDIDPPLEAALLMTPPAVTSEVVKDCVEARIHHVWMHQGLGRGAASPDAIALCRAHGITVVSGVCPLMFLPDCGFVHRAHRWWREIRP
ncbi:MAG TPA: CoA-binding protein [Vicinamibacteria bacterium]|nr:CoA-binding protein [Vicinamibacteria bacterium]